MCAVRITQGLLVSRTLNNLAQNIESLAVYQEQLATGLRVNAPSDDPIAARRAVNTRVSIQKNEQYLRNIESVGPQLTETVTSVETTLDALQRALELAVQGANGTNSQTQLDAIAEEVDQLLEEVLVQANHQTNGRYIFGGTNTLNPPYVTTRDADGNITAVTYEGNDTVSTVAISDGITVRANEPGSEVFTGGTDVFQMLIDIRDSLTAGDQAAIQGELLGTLDSAMDQLELSMARVGAVQNRLERSTTSIEDFNVELETLLSDSIDADYTETIVGLNAQSNAYEAALNAASRVITPSLLDYV